MWAESIERQERFTAAGLRCRQNFKYENVTSSFGRLRQKKIEPKGDAARLFFVIQPIKSLICSVVPRALFLPLLSSFLKLLNSCGEYEEFPSAIVTVSSLHHFDCLDLDLTETMVIG